MTIDLYKKYKKSILYLDDEWIVGSDYFCNKVVEILGKEKIKSFMLYALSDEEVIRKEKTNIFYLFQYCWCEELEKKLLEAIHAYYKVYFADGFCSISQSFKKFMSRDEFEKAFLEAFYKEENLQKKSKILMVLGFCVKLSDNTYRIIKSLKTDKLYEGINDILNTIIKSQEKKRQ